MDAISWSRLDGWQIGIAETGRDDARDTASEFIFNLRTEDRRHFLLSTNSRSSEEEVSGRNPAFDSNWKNRFF